MDQNACTCTADMACFACPDPATAHLEFVERENALIAQRAIAETHVRMSVQQRLDRAVLDVAGLELELELTRRRAVKREQLLNEGVELIQESAERLAYYAQVRAPTSGQRMKMSPIVRQAFDVGLEVHVFADGHRIY